MKLKRVIIILSAAFESFDPMACRPSSPPAGIERQQLVSQLDIAYLGLNECSLKGRPITASHGDSTPCTREPLIEITEGSSATEAKRNALKGY